MRFVGKVGFYVGDVETSTDVYVPQIDEKSYRGDVIVDRRKFQNEGVTNPDFTLNNRISILADLYAKENWHSIKYVVWNGTRFSVKSVEVNYPRLILSIGGEWNGDFERKDT